MPIPDPLHPAIVHFPLVLGVLLPFVTVWALVVSRRPDAGRRAWALVAVMAVLLSASAWVSVETGEQQEERVERLVPATAIHAHEEAAEGFLLGSGIVMAIILIGLHAGAIGRGARILAVPGALLIVLLAFRVGDSGGALVYQHGAAAAYVTDLAPSSEGARNVPRSMEEGRSSDEGHGSP